MRVPAGTGWGVGRMPFDPAVSKGRKAETQLMGLSHRGHLQPGRTHQVSARFSDNEWRLLQEAAVRAGITPTSYTATAAVREASGGAGFAAILGLREALVELQTTKAELRRVGGLLNQAVAVGHASGHLPSAVEPLTARLDRLAGEFEAQLALVAARLP
jgi:uncharacterized protein (DUF1778 family)